MTARRWGELTTEDAARLTPDTVALLPVAAIEQHGPHLPLATDAIINAGIVDRMVELAAAADAPPVVILPMLSVGMSPEHTDFSGTLSLSPETLLALVRDTAESVVRAGVRRIALFNSHGGQPQIMDIAAQQLRTRHRVAAAALNSWRLMQPGEFLPQAELEAGIHGGAVETALLLHLRPELVRGVKIGDFPSAARGRERDLPHLAGGGRFHFAWQTQDLNPSGAVGDARLATAEIGAKLTAQAAAGLLAQLTELSRLPLDVLKGR